MRDRQLLTVTIDEPAPVAAMRLTTTGRPSTGGMSTSRLKRPKETEAELRLQLGILFQLLSQYEDADKQLTLSLECFKPIFSHSRNVRSLTEQ